MRKERDRQINVGFTRNESVKKMFEGCRKVIHKPLSIKEKGKLKTNTNLRQSPKPLNAKKVDL